MENKNILPIALTAAFILIAGAYIVANASPKQKGETEEERLAREAAEKKKKEEEEKKKKTVDEKKNEKKDEVNPLSQQEIDLQNALEYNFNKFPVKKGQQGEAVEMVQILLLNLNNKAFAATGITKYFGDVTESELQKAIGKKKIENADDVKALKNKVKQKYNIITQIFTGLNIFKIQ